MGPSVGCRQTENMKTQDINSVQLTTAAMSEAHMITMLFILSTPKVNNNKTKCCCLLFVFLKLNVENSFNCEI